MGGWSISSTLEGLKPKAINHTQEISQVAHGFYHTSEYKLGTYMGSSRKESWRGSLTSGGTLWDDVKFPEALEDVVLA